MDPKNQLINVSLAQVVLPRPIENKRNEWVDFGEFNDFPLYLQILMQRSALHNAIIYSKVESIVGNGLTYDKKSDRKTDSWLAAPNPNETADDLLRKFAFDQELYGGFYANVIWSRDRKTISETYHIDFSKIRSGKADERGVVTEYFYCDNWAKARNKQSTIKRIQAFKADGSGDGSQLIFVKPYAPGQEYYPLPSYVGALTYIDVDAEIANFHLAHIRNGMNPSIILTFTNGIPLEEERKLIEKQIRDKFTTTDNAGKFMLMFAEDSTRIPQVTTVSPSQLDKQFLQLQDTVLQNILSGHRVVSPMLVGIKTEGQLGGSTELMNAYEIYNKTVLEPHIKIIETLFNKIGSINGLQELYIKPVEPVSFMWDQSILQNIMTVDEMRNRIGLEPMPVEDVTISQEPKAVQPTA